MSALYIYWALYTTVCIATLKKRLVLLNALNDVAVFGIFYNPCEHASVTYKIKPNQYCTEVFKSHCYYDSLLTNS